MSNTATTVAALLDAGAPDSPALSTPGGTPLTYRALRALSARTLAALNARGVGRNDRVAIVLDNGPEMAAAFVCIAGAATAAPLNPVYRAEEFEFYLTDLNAKILVIERGKVSPAIDVADKLNIPIVRLAATPDKGAGTFALEFPEGLTLPKADRPGPATACSTPPARRRVRRSCPWLSATSAPLPVISARRSPSRLRTADSTSCRCFIYMGSSQEPSRRYPPAVRSAAQQASTRCASSRGWRKFGPLGTRPFQPCTRPSSRAHPRAPT